MYKHQNLDIGEFRTFLGKHGIDATMKRYRMNRHTLKKICEGYQFELPGRGRPSNVLSPDQEQWIVDYRAKANIGAKFLIVVYIDIFLGLRDYWRRYC